MSVSACVQPVASAERPGAQLEVARVKQAARAVVGLDEGLRRPGDVPGGIERDPQPRPDVGGGLEEFEAVFLAALVGQPGVHQPGRDRRKDHLPVLADVVRVGVRDEGERLVVPRVEPQVVRGQVDAALVTDGGGGLAHREKLRAARRWRVHRAGGSHEPAPGIESRNGHRRPRIDREYSGRNPEILR